MATIWILEAWDDEAQWSEEACGATGWGATRFATEGEAEGARAELVAGAVERGFGPVPATTRTREVPATCGRYAFKAGDGATYSINGDRYPYTVRKVSPSGHAVWATADRVRGRGVYEMVDLPEDRWEKFTRRDDGSYRKVGGDYVFLSRGRENYQDPSF